MRSMIGMSYRRTLVLSFALGLLASSAFAQDAPQIAGLSNGVEWSPNPDFEEPGDSGLRGYRLFLKATDGTEHDIGVDKSRTRVTFGEIHDAFGLPNGSYTATVTAFDVAGNESPRSAPLLVQVDTIAPSTVINLKEFRSNVIVIIIK